MKRDGFIIEEIIEPDNMNEAFDYVLRGRKRRRGRYCRHLIRNREKVIAGIINDFISGDLHLDTLITKEINERGKTRVLKYVPLKKSIALHAMMTVVEKHLQKKWIKDTAASIKGRGMHYLHQRMLKDMQDHESDTLYVYQCDLKKFYESIDQDILIDCLRKYFKDERLINILTQSIRMLPTGVSIGKRDSQSNGNLLLSIYIDHVLKDKLGVKFYRRYCDDMLVQSDSFYTLTRIANVIHEQADKANLTIKKNESFYNSSVKGIDFLGRITYSDGNVRIRKHIKQRFARRWKRVKSKKRRIELIGSFYGMAKHCKAAHLFKTITGMSMKNFADFGISYIATDGKKRFECTYYPLGDLQNRTITVLDFERGIKTKSGENRYIVKFHSEELGDGKFMTNNDEMKQALDAIDNIDGGFPFQTTIKRQSFGTGKVKYKFT